MTDDIAQIYNDPKAAAWELRECILSLQRALTFQTERAEYALKNLDVVERARQEEMRKRDALTLQLQEALE